MPAQLTLCNATLNSFPTLFSPRTGFKQFCAGVPPFPLVLGWYQAKPVTSEHLKRRWTTVVAVAAATHHNAMSNRPASCGPQDAGLWVVYIYICLYTTKGTETAWSLLRSNIQMRQAV